MKFFDRRLYASIHWSNLPHWAQGDAVQFITFRLADSLPQDKLDEYRDLRKQLYYENDNYTRTGQIQQMIDKIDLWLDRGSGESLLQDAAVRDIIVKALDFWNNERYELLAYVIMPNHVHILLIPSSNDDIYSTIQFLKRFTAVNINRYLKRRGSVWESDIFDRMPRDNEEYNHYLEYIIDNPKHLPSSSYTLWVKGNGSNRAER